MTKSVIRAPFPYFGGKSRIAGIVWERFGNPANYVEPFFGTGAVLLMRPTEARTETVNDINGYLANFWRAIVADPEAVAEHADWPVNECDLHARHLWLVNDGFAHVERLKTEPDFYDAKIAGWWVWGICQWIGSGWCVRPEWTGRTNAGRRSRGINSEHWQQRPELSGAGQGVHRVDALRPHLLTDPNLRGDGAGVHRPYQKMPEVGSDRGVTNTAIRSNLVAYFQALQERLRRVRVCCGDWSRVVTPSVTTANRLTAVFLDPPYSTDERDGQLYMTDESGVAAAAREWALTNGDNPRLRIALCGYEGEHAMPESWSVYRWKAAGGYGSQGEGRGRDNASRERIWFSPHCLNQGDLFSAAGVEVAAG